MPIATTRLAAAAVLLAAVAAAADASAVPGPTAKLCFSSGQCYPAPVVGITTTPAQRLQAAAETEARLGPSIFTVQNATRRLKAAAADHPVLRVSDSELLDFVAVSGYTASTQGLNDELRKTPANASIEANTLAICSAMNRLREALGPAANEPVLTYRGVALPDAVFDEWRQTAAGSPLGLRAFFSTSANLTTARMFAKLDNSSQWWTPGTTRVVMAGLVCTAAEISFLGYYDFSLDQTEHLVPPGVTLTALDWEDLTECHPNGTEAQTSSVLFYTEATQGSACAAKGAAALPDIRKMYDAQYAAMPPSAPRTSYCGGGGAATAYAEAHEDL